MSFAEILEGKINQDLKKDLSRDLGYDSGPLPEKDMDYSYLSYLLGHTDLRRDQNSVRTFGKTPYMQYRPKPKPRQAHALNAEQTKAYEVLTQQTSLHPAFTRQELKKAYREAAKTAHPDLGGSPALFIEVRKAYQILFELL